LGIVGALLPAYDNANLVVNRDDKKVINDIRILIDQIVSGKLANPSLLKKYHFILESCEHKEHMLMYDYDHLMVTNIGYDHQDYYKTQADYYNAFVLAIKKAKKSVLVPT
jgi:UDP-N-acetylmuramate-alanine ligase